VLSVPSAFVEHAAVVAGFSAHVLDRLLARHLPRYLGAMSDEQRAEVAAAHAAIHRAALRYAETPTAASGRAVQAVDEGGSGLRREHESSVAEVADMLGLSPRRVRVLAVRWESEGLARKSGRDWLIDAVAALAELDERKRSA
jgi:CRP-like cAMP-binding protein